MAIIKIVDINVFRQSFVDMDRENNFSYKGLVHLFDYLEQYSEDTEDIELDILAICCDYSEYKSIEELSANYNLDLEPDENGDFDLDEVHEALQYNTTVLCCDKDCILIQSY